MQFPERNFLNKGQLSEFLECDEKTIDLYLKEKLFPVPIIRPKEKRPVWDKDAAAICLWILKNPGRFSGECQEPDSSG